MPVPEDNLPITLPEDTNFDMRGNPLDNHPTWKYTQCPKCNKNAIRETDTFDTFFESSWYFARFTDLNPSSAFTKEAVKYWMPVDQYIGGVEHAVMHLLYSRFFMRAIKHVNTLDIEEPFTSLQTQGMVCHQTFKTKKEKWVFPSDIVKKGNEHFHLNTKEPVIAGRVEKMSKSKKNVVDPQQIIEDFGADTARFFVLSDSPPNRDMEWSDSGVEGSWRFLNKLWKFVKSLPNKNNLNKLPKNISLHNKELLSVMHATIKDVTKAIEDFHFNIAVAQIRNLFNVVFAHKVENDDDAKVVLFVISRLLVLINPMVPHISEELWYGLGLSLIHI